jgi:hypothetical protein
LLDGEDPSSSANGSAKDGNTASFAAIYAVAVVLVVGAAAFFLAMRYRHHVRNGILAGASSKPFDWEQIDESHDAATVKLPPTAADVILPMNIEGDVMELQDVPGAAEMVSPQEQLTSLTQGLAVTGDGRPSCMVEFAGVARRKASSSFYAASRDSNKSKNRYRDSAPCECPEERGLGRRGGG